MESAAAAVSRAGLTDLSGSPSASASPCHSCTGYSEVSDTGGASHAHTTSVSRSYSHLHYPTFMLSAFSLCWLRTAVQQPLNIALVRKQSSPAFTRYSTSAILRHIYRHEGGMRGVLRGMPALTMGCASSEVVYLALLEYGRECLPFQSEASRAAVAAYGADGVCRLLHIPLVIVSYRQMTSTAVPMTSATASSTAPFIASNNSKTAVKKPPLNWFRTLKGMYAERGLRTIYAGLGTTLVVGTQWSAVWWPLYGYIKSVLYTRVSPFLEHLPPNQKNPSPPPPSNGVSPTSISFWRYIPDAITNPVDNAVVSTVASSITSAWTAIIFNPFLVLRTNLQVLPNASLWSTAKHIYQHRGWKGFYGGLSLSIATCVLDGALSSLTYEYARLWADVTKKQHEDSSVIFPRATTTTKNNNHNNNETSLSDSS
eukprot:gene9547-6703_t